MTNLFTEMSHEERREVRMYGCTKADMQKAVESQMSLFKGKCHNRDIVTIATYIMSHCQAMLNHDNGGTHDLMTVEDVRQSLNRVKWILSTYIKEAV